MRNDIDRDLYEILGVGRSATIADIKSAYRKKARECHPDVAGDDPDSEYKFKELTFAYEILSDDNKRREYDSFGLRGLGRDIGMDFSGFTSLSDLIDVFFGDAFGGTIFRRSGRRVRTRGRDIQTALTISLNEAAWGTNKKIEVERLASCEECGGTGLMPGTHMSRCDMCSGSGQVKSTQQSFFGTVIRSTTCPSCNGRGELITEPCRECAGESRKWVAETLEVKVPPGMDRGDSLRIREKGEGGLNGGPTGDLFVVLNVESHPAFKRDGKNLLTSVPIDMVEAALGTELKIETLDGEFKLKVSPGTQPGQVLKVKGKGIPERGGGRRGDILVRVDVTVPSKINSEQKMLLEKLRETRKEKAGKGQQRPVRKE
ncbi:MAG: molecular chaperone DnaJ [Actinobacteria bacterium]|nr:molecular chaperone DnaJ [Actinomycetota bacterium]